MQGREQSGQSFRLEIWWAYGDEKAVCEVSMVEHQNINASKPLLSPRRRYRGYSIVSLLKMMADPNGVCHFRCLCAKG